MKFQPDRLEGVNTIQRHEPGAVWVQGQPWRHSVLVPWTGPVQPWPPADSAALAAGDFDAVLALAPDLVVFGSGARLKFVAPALYRGLIERRIGLETMDTAAACRTFNVLVSEGRSVVAALIVGGDPGRPGP
jgi:uncharacterized protein